MIPLNYKERYKQLLQKDKITKKDVRLFNKAVAHFEKRYPDWKNMDIAV
tara:strand:+ start:21410 stop:21556 length:147 start_codon:yes stop_codon:yes gene_type:complete